MTVATTYVVLRLADLVIFGVVARSHGVSIRRLLMSWDAGWYLRSALEGYPKRVPTDAAGHALQSTMNWPPVLPSLGRLGALLLPAHPSGAASAALLAASIAGGLAAAVLLCATLLPAFGASRAIGSAVLFVLIVFRLALRHRFRHDTTAPSLVVAVSGNFPSRPLVEQRNQALLRGNKLNEPAGALARHWFSQLGIDVLAGSDPPPFRVAGTWGERRRLARRLRALWELASGRSTTPVGAPQMWKLQREMEQLRVARERGQWDIDGSKVARPLTAGARTRSGG